MDPGGRDADLGVGRREGGTQGPLTTQAHLSSLGLAGGLAGVGRRFCQSSGSTEHVDLLSSSPQPLHVLRGLCAPCPLLLMVGGGIQEVLRSSRTQAAQPGHNLSVNSFLPS